MISFQPVSIARRGRFLGQTPAPASPAPATPVIINQETGTPPLIKMLGWSVIGFASGAVAGYTLGKGMGRKSDMMDALIGGVGGTVSAVIARIL